MFFSFLSPVMLKDDKIANVGCVPKAAGTCRLNLSFAEANSVKTCFAAYPIGSMGLVYLPT